MTQQGTVQYRRHYNPSEVRPHHYGQGATQRIYKFENGHPDISVIPACLGNGTVVLDRFEVAELGPTVHVLASYVDEQEVQRILDACAGAYRHAT